MSEHNLPRTVRESRGLVGIKSKRAHIPARILLSPLKPGSRKWRDLEQLAKQGSGDALKAFYDLHGKLAATNVYSSHHRDIAPGEAA